MTRTDIKTALFVAYKTIVNGHISSAILIVFILSLSFFNLMFVSGFLSGFSDGIMRSMIDTSTAHLIVLPQEKPFQKEYIVDQSSVRARIETIPGVTGTTRHYLLGGTFAYDKDHTGTFSYVSAPLIGITQLEEKKIMTVRENIVAGGFPDVLRDDEIIIGANLSGGYGTKQTTDLGGVRVGDTVQVTYAQGFMRTYTVKGIFKISMGSAGNSAFISAQEAEAVLSTYNTASEILVRTDLKRYSLDEYATRIHTLFPELTVEKYTTRLSTVGILVSAFNIIALIVSVISIIVSAITIFVMIYVHAISKRRQIGILKAIGIKESIIELSYVVQSLFYSILGILCGLAIIFWFVTPFLTIRPIIMPYGATELVYTSLGITINIMSSIIAGLLAGFIPAKLVARENILTSIWG